MINHPNRNKKKQAVSATTKVKPKKDPTPPEGTYDLLASACQRSYNSVAAPTGAMLFRVQAPELWSYYIQNLPKSQRQEHDCSACRHFLKHYGPVVTIDPNGRIHSAMFNAPVPILYKKAFAAMKSYVESGRVLSPFMVGKRVWGQPVTGVWKHMAVTPKPCHVHHHLVHTAGQTIANKVQAFKNVKAGLAEYNAATLDELLRMLRGNHLNRSDQFLAPVEWLRKLHDLPKGKTGTNLLWAAVTAAPEGYTHPRSAVWASVLDDIKAGVSFQAMQRKFAEKTHGLIYQRPQAPPKAQNIARAEDLVAKLGITLSLDRRMARLDEVVSQAVWLPGRASQDGQQGRGGVFGHLKSQQDNSPPSVKLPSTTMTWEKFAREVLSQATALQLHVPHMGNFVALTTAQDPEAPPILKWDRPDERNPFAWYCYNNGSPASQWGLKFNHWADVTAVVPNPATWGADGGMQQYKSVVLTLEGCIDSNEGSGNALFPECLKNELHEVRSTIEAYSQRAALGGRVGQLASGFCINANAKNGDAIVRAFIGGAWQQYQIDRWD